MMKFLLRIGCIIALLFIFGVNAFARPIDTIIIHHSAGSPLDECDHSAAEIDRWHKERGWDGIGYHFVIRKTGLVEVGRSINKVGAHAKGRNAGSIGICVIGYSDFNFAQKVALASLINKLCKEYSVTKIERHHEQCPGRALDVERLASGVLLAKK